MKVHANALLGPKGRLVMACRVVDEGWSLAAAAEAAGVSERTARTWVTRYRDEGEAGLVDRSSAPKSVPLLISEERRQSIAALRRLRFTGPEIADALDMALSTISGLLKEMGMGKLGRLGMEPAERYERGRPGELIHIDVKKLGKISRPGHKMTGSRAAKGYHAKQHNLGWEFVHVAIDDCTRLAYVEVLNDEKAITAAGFLRRAVDYYRRHGITVERLITDNGSAYRSTVHAIACRAMRIHHLRTRPYRPQTNGKAERFIRTMLAGWAYGALYRNSTERAAALDGWLHYYNHQRPHSALGRQPPIARVNERTNVLGTYI